MPALSIRNLSVLCNGSCRPDRLLPPLYMVAKGDVFGPNQSLILHLLDIPPMMGVLEGVVMELADCALPLLHSVVPTDDPAVAFKDVSAAFLVGAMPRREGMERKDLLAANVRPVYPEGNFTAMTRLDQNRAQSQIAAKVGVPVANVSNVIIWGNHSSTQFPDASHAVVTAGGKEQKAPAVVNDDAWLRTYFVETVQKRGAAVIAARKMSSAMSAAKAACDHMRDWFLGTAPGKFVSMGVVTGRAGKWEIVQGLPVDALRQGEVGPHRQGAGGGEGGGE
ncbi:hypothetical protein NQ318_005270 [Aromia moschata]|uniref:Malate dehydrogenase n=1 Tax=Aromia moschata TaxID=1265417 RepID=A0AAV8Y1J7_9CUCU|nr:hypothetical protein NQ318_005270 [Aromia moschata]